jgi:hypothetical protein
MILVIERDGQAVGACDLDDLPGYLDRLSHAYPGEILTAWDPERPHVAPEIGVPHGTEGGYTHYGCRAECCASVHRDAEARRFVERHARLLADPTCVAHGRAAAYYGWGCRCVPCTTAAQQYERAKARRYRERDLYPLPLLEVGAWSTEVPS